MSPRAQGRGARGVTVEGDGLAWTRAQRKRLRGPLHPHPLDPRDRTASGPQHWTELVGRFRAGRSLRRRPAQAPTKALRERVERVYADFESGALPEKFDRDDELVRAAIARFDHEDPSPRDGTLERALVGFWARNAGVAFAVGMIAKEAEFGVTGRYSPRIFFEVDLTAVTREEPGFVVQTVEHWSALRPYVVELQVDSDEYRAARSAALEARTHGIPWMASAVALAFPRETGWAAEDVAAGVARLRASTSWQPDPCWPALASLADAALAQQLAELAAGPRPDANYAHFAAAYALDLVDVLGPAAARPLATMLPAATQAPVRRALAEALVLASPELARQTLDTIASSPEHAALAKALGD